jgi:hypothetical protein
VFRATGKEKLPVRQASAKVCAARVAPAPPGCATVGA